MALGLVAFAREIDAARPNFEEMARVDSVWLVHTPVWDSEKVLWYGQLDRQEMARPAIELVHKKFSGDYRQSVPATPPGDPIAKVQVLYVQFEDKSTFRASGGPNSLYQNRAASLRALKQLNRVLGSAGKDGFEASLREGPDYNQPLRVLQTISKVLQPVVWTRQLIGCRRCCVLQRRAKL